MSAYAALESSMGHVGVDLSLRGQEKQATFILMRYETFGLLGDVSIRKLTGFPGLGEQMTRKHLASIDSITLPMRDLIAGVDGLATTALFAAKPLDMSVRMSSLI